MSTAPSHSLSLLYEETDMPCWRLPAALAAAYGGSLGFAEPCLYGNFVASLDGVVALGPEYPSSGSAISGRESADRFVMGLLRACADAVVIGAGTLRATPGHRWTPEYVWPAGAGEFAELRRSLGRAGQPELVVVTGTGDVPTDHAMLQAGALIITTENGARQLEGRLPPPSAVLAVADGPLLGMTDVVAAMRDRGHAALLTEGGPHLLAELVCHSLLNELFLTVSPVLAGRGIPERPGLLAGLELLPGRSERARLVSVRRSGSYLFLRYRLEGGLV